MCWKWISELKTNTRSKEIVWTRRKSSGLTYAEQERFCKRGVRDRLGSRRALVSSPVDRWARDAIPIASSGVSWSQRKHWKFVHDRSAIELRRKTRSRSIGSERSLFDRETLEINSYFALDILVASLRGNPSPLEGGSGFSWRTRAKGSRRNARTTLRQSISSNSVFREKIRTVWLGLPRS